MLTVRQNLMETITGGNPDRFVKQYEFLKFLRNPVMAHSQSPKRGEENVVNSWGVTHSWRADQPGAFPVHTPEKVVIKDITRWRDYVHAPQVKYSEAEWEPFIEAAENVDRSQYFVAPMMIPGILEQCHHLGEISNTMANFYEEPECMHELIGYITEYELELAEQICHYLKPDAIFHHDDWGTQISTFLSPDMFAEFFLEPYKQVYGYFHDHGVQLVVHHSDSYAATLVPYMIEMGIDIWQGVMQSNDIPALIAKYGGQISFMGGIDSAKVDYEGWSHEVIAAEVKRACDECGKHFFIPSASQGLNISNFAGVYEAIDEEIDRYSKIVFA